MGKTLVLCLLLMIIGIPGWTVFAATTDHHGFTVDAAGNPQLCMSCHDGSTAMSVVYCTVLCDFSTAHSIEKRYPPRGKESDYAPLSDVTAAGIRIVNGRVTCISCHDLINPGKFHLIRNDRHKLCSLCHIREAGGAHGGARRRP